MTRARWLLVAGGAAAGLLVAELALRLREPEPGFYVRDEHTGTRLRPGARGWWRGESEAWVEVNPAGFRDREHPLAKPPRTLRIAVLGDSFVEAVQVPLGRAFPAVMERELGRCEALGGRPVEVLSFGVSGWGTAQELLALEHHVAPYAPDLVLLAFFPGNDLRNNSRQLEPDRQRPFFVREGDRLRLDDSFRRPAAPRGIRALYAPLREGLARRSHLVQAVDRFRYRRRVQAEAQALGDLEAGLDREALGPPRDAAWREAWEVTERLLAEMRRVSAAHGAAFWVVAVSVAPQVDPDPLRRQEEARRLGVPDLLYPQRRLLELGRRAGFPVVDLVPVLRAAAEGSGQPMHGFGGAGPARGHWNQAGHRAAGRELADRVCSALAGGPAP